MCVQMCRHMCACVYGGQGPVPLLRSHPLCCLTQSFETWDLPVQVKLACCKLHLSSTGVPVMCYHTWPFTWMLGIELSSCFHRKHFPDQPTSLAALLCFKCGCSLLMKAVLLNGKSQKVMSSSSSGEGGRCIRDKSESRLSRWRAGKDRSPKNESYHYPGLGL